MTILAIDPGPVESAYVLGESSPEFFKKVNNEELLKLIPPHAMYCGPVVIEMVQSFGMAVGAEVFDTVFWIGRYFEAAHAACGEVHRLFRSDIKSHLCHSAKATDANIRQALIDRFGGNSVALDGKVCSKRKQKNHGAECPICRGSGWERPPGPLAGISGDCWSALAVLITFKETRAKNEASR